MLDKIRCQYKNSIALVLIAMLGTSAKVEVATTLTFTNNTSPDTGGNHYSLESGYYDNAGNFISTAAPNNSSLGMDREFRLITPASGQIGGRGKVAGGRTYPTAVGQEFRYD